MQNTVCLQVKDLKLICPITLELIETIGMTSNGSVYDYDSIVKWLATNDTDPLTNQLLNTQKVEKITDNDLGEITVNQLSRNKMHEYKVQVNSEKRWKIKLDEIYNYKLLAKSYTDFNTVEWKNHSSKLRALFLNMKNRDPYSNYEHLSYSTEIKSFSKYINFYDFVNLSNLKIVNKRFKSFSFYFTNFENCHFIDCDISSNSFVKCNLNNAYFTNCRFKGEQGNFYKSYGKMHFTNCNMEYLTTWNTTVDINECIKILQTRSLLGEYSIDNDTLIVKV